MKKNKKLFSSIALSVVVLAAVGIYACREEKVPTPDFREELDLTLTQNEFYLEEESFKETMEQEIEPYLESCMKEDYLQNGDIKLHYKVFQTGNAEKAIVISHGFMEYSDKYNETIYYYLKGGYDVYLMEHRGHGYSTREVEDLSLSYISSFDKYQEDFKLFMDTVVVPENGDQPLYLFAHSMGGAIGVRFLEDNPGYFKAAVLSSPMMDINTGSIPEPLANLFAKVNCLIGRGKSYLIGHVPYDKDLYDINLSSASNEARYSYYYSLESTNEMYQSNAGSYAWLKAAIAETKNILKEENLEKINIPVLLFQAENDSLVEEQGLFKLASGLKDIEFKFVAESKHQVYSTGNETLFPYYNTIFRFLEEAN